MMAGPGGPPDAEDGPADVPEPVTPEASRGLPMVTLNSRRSGTPEPGVGLLGTSAAISQVRETIAVIGPTDLRVLIQGESGTGKELVATAIHNASGRKPFVPVNCAAVPATLIESEFFGHVRGAFTGADMDRAGLLEQANGGTLFLDELGDLPVFVQAKLLRALDAGEVRRLGSARLVQVNVRLIAATNRDLRTEVEAGRFRKDLYWRLSDDSIKLPPLRERHGDIRLLATHFAHDHGLTISSGAMALLEACPWPGNVRELRSAIARAAAFATGSEIQTEDFPTAIRSNANDRWVEGGSLRLDDVVRQHVLDVLNRTRGKQAEAATLLGIDRKTLRRKLRQYADADDKARGNGPWR